MSASERILRQGSCHCLRIVGFCWRSWHERCGEAERRYAGAAESLSERDREILALERLWWQYAGAKEQAIRDKFDMSATRYYQVLNALIDREDALAYDPLLVKRLRRLRAQRQRSRSARRLGIDL